MAACFFLASFLAAFFGGILKTNAGTRPSTWLLYTAEVSAHTMRCKCQACTCSTCFGQLNLVPNKHGPRTHLLLARHVEQVTMGFFKKTRGGSALCARIHTGHACHPYWGESVARPQL
jgi:hypothetical protein